MFLKNKLESVFCSDKFTAKLKTSLRKYGYQLNQRINKDTYKISSGKSTATINVATLVSATSDREFNKLLSEMIKAVEANSEVEKRLVSFTNAQVSLRFVVMREEDITSDLISTDFVGNLKKIVVYTPDDNIIHTLDKSYLKKWDVPKEVLFSVADRNMCKLLSKAEISESVIKDNIKVLEISCKNKQLCVSLMMCNDFRRVIAEYLGPKFLVVAPSCESMLILDNVTNNILEGLGMVIINEYKKAEKPLTTDVLLFDTNGINVAGKFSAKEERKTTDIIESEATL